MSKNASFHGEDLPLAVRARIDSVCVLFEDAWKAGQHPRAEQFLPRVPVAERGALLYELLRVELHYRRIAGESLDPGEYLARFPDHPQIVAGEFRQRIQCPACSSELEDDAAVCPHCGLSRPRLAALPTCAMEDAVDSTPLTREVATKRSAESPRAETAEQGRFLPGTVLAGRYRIVSLLGRGGMGEVYRVDDLKLGQPVALKLLPEKLAEDAEILKLFHNEVRLARQIAHPNLCHVYDIGEADGLHFLSMEYVDGEDLASLLRRIGRLPPDRGLIIARQLIAGLSAAHEQGIIHRDLKPRNIMLDGRGRVRITDFGLACLIESSAEAIRAGTPLYMSPEQLADGPVTVRSDLYSVGLVLYEIFTGQRPLQAESLEELRRLREDRPVPSPSSIVDGLDPTVERAILLCLESTPRDRPPSARALLASLPGGDPLQAALASGETPSPEMVAAIQQPGHLHLAVSGLCLGAIALGLAVVLLLSNRTTLVGQSRLLSPHALAERARQYLADCGYAATPADAAFGFAYGAGPDRSAPIIFWYRQSPSVLVPTLFAGSFAAEGDGCVSWDDPAPTAPGEARVRLDAQSRLLEFRIVPMPSSEETPAGPTEGRAEQGVPEWCSKLFVQAGLVESDDKPSDLQGFDAVPATWTVPLVCDSRKEWRGVCPWSGCPVRLEAAALRGRPVYFRIVPVDPETKSHGLRESPSTARAYLKISVFLLLVTAAGLLARHNLLRGRGDRRGGLRLAWYMLVAYTLYWLLHGGRAARPPPWPVLIMGLEMAVFVAILLWLFYIALEPFVRRLWPETLVSWNRLLAGRWRDPLVGRDVLVGAAFGVVTKLLWQLAVLAPAWLGLGPARPTGPQPAPFGTSLRPLLGGRYCVAELFHCQMVAVAYGLTLLLMLLLLRVILRRQRLAAGVYIVYAASLASFGEGYPLVSCPIAAAASAIVVLLLTRFGLLAVVTYWLVRMLLSFPMTANLSAWQAGGTTLLPLAAILALAVCGFYLTQAGRPLIRDTIVR